MSFYLETFISNVPQDLHSFLPHFSLIPQTWTNIPHISEIFVVFFFNYIFYFFKPFIVILILFFDKKHKKIIHRFCYNLLGSLAQLVRSLSYTYEDLSSSLRNHVILLPMMICTRNPHIGGREEGYLGLAGQLVS